VHVHCNASVEKLSSGRNAQSISAEGSSRWTATLANGGVYSADAVVLATGGLSFPAVGTDGTGHRIAQLVRIATFLQFCTVCYVPCTASIKADYVSVLLKHSQTTPDSHHCRHEELPAFTS
jgi:predicted flavoprotein YhiN